MKNPKSVILNRIVSFLAGGLLVFAVMSFTVVSKLKVQNTELENSLDTSRFEAGRLLADAQAQFLDGDFEKAKLSLTTLIENQPGSREAAEGRDLFPKVETAEAAIISKWESALPEIQAEWRNNMASQLRAEWDADRVKLDNELESKIDQAWDKAIDGIRSEWMAQTNLN